MIPAVLPPVLPPCVGGESFFPLLPRPPPPPPTPWLAPLGLDSADGFTVLGMEEEEEEEEEELGLESENVAVAIIRI